jgi:hypothetical protein
MLNGHFNDARPISKRGFSMSKRALLVLLLLFVLAVAVAGCGSNKDAEVTQAPVVTLHPTFTPTATKDFGAPAPTDVPVQATEQAPEAETPTPEPPTPTPEPPTPTPVPPTPTPKPNPQVKITADLVNLRSGPGTNYAKVGQAKKGQTFDILGKNSNGSWYQISANGKTVWVINDPKFTATVGDAGAVKVAENIPAPPPTPKPHPTKPPAPTATPAPVYLFEQILFEPRINSNPIVTFYGGLYNRTLDLLAPVTGYKLVVITPAGQRMEVDFGPAFLRGDPGLDSEFLYNAKLEVRPPYEGVYQVFVADAAGNQVAPAFQATVSGDTRTFLVRWKER